MEGGASLEGGSGLDKTRGGLPGGVLLRGAAAGMAGGARAGGEGAGLERRPMISAAEVLFSRAGCYGNTGRT